MADNDFNVIMKAKELIFHTFTLTSNCNRYPKKYRHSLVDRMQLISMDICFALMEANRINNKTHRRERCEKITYAITCCEELQVCIELSMKLGLLADNSAAYWSRLISDVKHMSIAWRTKESH